MQKKEVTSLTALRAFAALWVGLHHGFDSLEGVQGPGPLWLARLFSKGWLGVDLFFVLSGFIMAYTYQERLRSFSFEAYQTFLVRRFARIYPVHLFTLILFLLMVIGGRIMGVFVDPENKYSLSEFLSQALLLHGTGLIGPKGWNVPSWSISSEALAYVFFPLLLYPVSRATSVGRSVVSILGLLILAVSLALTLNDGKKFMLDFNHTWFRILSEFTMGLLLFNVTRFKRPSGLYYGLVAASSLGILSQGLVAGSFYDFMYLVYFLLLIHSLTLLPETAPWPWARTAGEISFSFYLVHSLVIIALNQVIRKIPVLGEVPFLSLGLFIVVSGGVAWLMYNYVETPARRLLNSWYERRKDITCCEAVAP